MNRAGACALAAAAFCLQAGLAHAARPLPRPVQTRACAQQDIAGGWKLFRVYAQNESQPAKDFQENPQQYLYLANNQLVARVNGKEEYKEAPALQKLVQKSLADTREQYVLDANGIMFLYQNSKNTGALHCGIITQQYTLRIVPGDMVLKLAQPTGEVHYIYKRQPMQINEKAAKSTAKKTKKK